MNAQITNYAPGALLALASTSTTVTITGARAGMSVVATPQGDPGVNFYWSAWVSSNDTVTLKIGALVVGTPATVSWTIRVIP